MGLFLIFLIGGGGVWCGGGGKWVLGVVLGRDDFGSLWMFLDDWVFIIVGCGFCVGSW